MPKTLKKALVLFTMVDIIKDYDTDTSAMCCTKLFMAVTFKNSPRSTMALFLVEGISVKGWL